MSVETKRSPVALRDVLYEFSLAADRPNAELLDEFVRRYPEYASELTDFAIELVIEADRNAEVSIEVAPMSPVVSRAVSKYQNALHARMSSLATNETVSASSMAMCANPFALLDRQSFRSLANELNVTLVFLCKLRDCLVDPTTITTGFRRYIANTMRISVDQLTGYFAGSVPRLEMQFYKADQKPEARSQQSFEEAVRNSGHTQEQQEFLLSL